MDNNGNTGNHNDEPNLLEYLVNGIKKLWSKFRKPSPSTGIGWDQAIEREKEFAKVITSLEKLGDELTAMQVKKHFMSILQGFGDIFGRCGYDDGKKELNPKLILNFSNFKAIQLQSYIQGVFKSKVSSLETTLKDKKLIYEIVEKDYHTQDKYVQTIEKKYRFEYKDFSLSMGILYIIFSMGFLIADFPLSNLIVGQGFEIESPIEVLLLTIGITLIGVYFKIWWDEYINPAVEKVVTKNAANNLDGFEELSDENQKKAIRTVKFYRYLRGLIKTIILLSSLACISVLGFFRYIVYLNETFTAQGKPIPPALESIWAVSGFLLISVLFPFLGGICLSIGADKIQNWRERRSAMKKLSKKEREKSNSLRAKEEAQKELDASNEYLKWCISTDFIKNCQNLFTARYNRGYEIGFTEINLEMNILTKAENIRKRALGRKTFKETQPIIETSYFNL